MRYIKVDNQQAAKKTKRVACQISQMNSLGR